MEEYLVRARAVQSFYMKALASTENSSSLIASESIEVNPFINIEYVTVRLENIFEQKAQAEEAETDSNKNHLAAMFNGEAISIVKETILQDTINEFS